METVWHNYNTRAHTEAAQAYKHMEYKINHCNFNRDREKSLEKILLLETTTSKNAYEQIQYT